MIKISIAGDGAPELKAEIAARIQNAIPQFIEDFKEPVTITIRRPRPGVLDEP